MLSGYCSVLRLFCGLDAATGSQKGHELMHACVFTSAKAGLMVMRLSHLVMAGHPISCIGL